MVIALFTLPRPWQYGHGSKTEPLIDSAGPRRTALLSGLVVVGRHVLKNALAPVVTLSAVQMGNLLGGAVVSETIFTLPGVGRFLVDAILHRDYPVVQTIVILFAAVVVMLNLLTDVLYSWFDPRTRQT